MYNWNRDFTAQTSVVSMSNGTLSSGGYNNDGTLHSINGAAAIDKSTTRHRVVYELAQPRVYRHRIRAYVLRVSRDCLPQREDNGTPSLLSDAKRRGFTISRQTIKNGVRVPFLEQRILSAFFRWADVGAAALT
jgi:hypothetical protein